MGVQLFPILVYLFMDYYGAKRTQALNYLEIILYRRNEHYIKV